MNALKHVMPGMLWAATFLLAACATTGRVSRGGATAPVTVVSTTAPRFYYVRSDIFQSAGASDVARLQHMTEQATFGPFQTDHTELNLLIGKVYLFFPQCDSKPLWKDNTRPAIRVWRGQNTVTVECRREGG